MTIILAVLALTSIIVIGIGLLAVDAITKHRNERVAIRSISQSRYNPNRSRGQIF